VRLISPKNASLSTSVLIVEDEPFSRFHAVNLVEDAGFIAMRLPMLTKLSQFWNRAKTYASSSRILICRDLWTA